MSRSNKNDGRLVNPATRWLEWSSEDKCLKWYDKETKENYLVPLPFKFLVLDQLNTVTGFSEEMDTGFYATEVRVANQPITLFANKKVFASGIWKTDLKPIPGTKFTKSVYIGYFDDGELKLGNIKFAGASLNGLSEKAVDANLEAFKKDPKKVEVYTNEFLDSIGWFNFTSSNKDIEDIAVSIVDSVPDKHGKVNFNRPIFQRIDKVSEETNEAAIALDVELQMHLGLYFEKNKSGEHEAHDDENDDWIDQRNDEMFDSKTGEMVPAGEEKLAKQKAANAADHSAFAPKDRPKYKHPDQTDDDLGF